MGTSEGAKKAWETIRANQAHTKRSLAAHKAWATIRAKQRSLAAKKAWKTRKCNKAR